MAVAVTGAGGLLGRTLVAALGADALPLGHERLDVADVDAVRRVIADARPSAVVHCAALTDVDACELDPDRATAVNALGSEAVAAAAAAAGAPVVCVSTDYVFDGRKGAPYVEDDEPRPVQVYGRSKLEGERLALAANPRCAVVRSAWIYGPGGKNFLSRLPGLVASGTPIRAVVDQIGSPTFAPDLASAIVDLLGRGGGGVFHVANEGAATFVDVCRLALDVWGTDADVEEVRVADLGRPAPRPSVTTLHGERWLAAGFAPLRPWRDAAEEFFSGDGGGSALA